MDNHTHSENENVDPRPDQEGSPMEFEQDPPSGPGDLTSGGETVRMGEAMPTAPIISDPEVDYPSAPDPDEDQGDE